MKSELVLTHLKTCTNFVAAVLAASVAPVAVDGELVLLLVETQSGWSQYHPPSHLVTVGADVQNCPVLDWCGVEIEI